MVSSTQALLHEPSRTAAAAGWIGRTTRSWCSTTQPQPIGRAAFGSGVGLRTGRLPSASVKSAGIFKPAQHLTSTFNSSLPAFPCSRAKMNFSFVPILVAGATGRSLTQLPLESSAFCPAGCDRDFGGCIQDATQAGLRCQSCQGTLFVNKVRAILRGVALMHSTRTRMQLGCQRQHAASMHLLSQPLGICSSSDPFPHLKP